MRLASRGVLKGAQFLGRIEMPEEQLETLLEIIASQLDGAMHPKACARRLAQNYPAAVAYALVQLAAEEYAEAEVWPQIAERLGGQEVEVAWELRFSIEKCRQRYSLADCEPAKKLAYVTPLLFQGGVPDSCIPELIDIVWNNCVQHGKATPRAVLQWLRDEPEEGAGEKDNIRSPSLFWTFLNTAVPGLRNGYLLRPSF